MIDGATICELDRGSACLFYLAGLVPSSEIPSKCFRRPSSAGAEGLILSIAEHVASGQDSDFLTDAC